MTTTAAGRLILALGAVVALATLAIADLGGAGPGAWGFVLGLAAAAALPYVVLWRAARTGPAWVALLAAVLACGLDLGARIRVRWFPQDAQDALLLVALPMWLIPGALLVWCGLALAHGRREARRRGRAP